MFNVCLRDRRENVTVAWSLFTQFIRSVVGNNIIMLRLTALWPPEK